MEHWLFSKNGVPSKTAFWFSTTMLVTLILVVAITIELPRRVLEVFRELGLEEVWWLVGEVLFGVFDGCELCF